MSEPIATWLQDILPRTPGVVRAVAKREFVLAAREFYRQSASWRETLAAVDVTAGDPTYTATPTDATSEVLQIVAVEYDGLPLDPKVDRPLGDVPTGTPTMWYPTGRSTFVLWPTPETTKLATLIVRVLLQPKDDTTTLPDMAYQLHYDALLDGVLGRLYAHPAKPYSNLTGAQYHLGRFRNAIAAAAGAAKQGNINGQNWTFPPYGK